MVAVPLGNNQIDRWLVWPYICLAAFPVILLVTYALNTDMAGMFVLLIWGFFALVSVFIFPIFAYTAYRAGCKRRALSVILVPLAIALSIFLTPVSAYLGDRIFFYRIHRSLQQAVNKTPGQDSQKLVIWLEGGFAGAEYGFAYDGSDELAMPAGKQTATWKQRAAHTEFGDNCFGASHIMGHYYSFSTTHGC